MKQQYLSTCIFILVLVLLFLSGCGTTGEKRPNLLYFEKTSTEVIQTSQESIVEILGTKRTVKKGDCTQTHKEVVDLLDLLQKEPLSKIELTTSSDGINVFCEYQSFPHISFGSSIEGFTPTGLIAKRLCSVNETNPEKYIPLLEHLRRLGDKPSQVAATTGTFKGEAIKYSSLLDLYINCLELTYTNENIKTIAELDMKSNKAIWNYLLTSKDNSLLSTSEFLKVKNKQLSKELVPLMGDLNRQITDVPSTLNTILGAVLLHRGLVIGESADPHKVELLLDAGADPNLSYDNSGQPPLHYLLTDFYIPLDNKLKSANLLLEYGADPNAEYYIPITNLNLRDPLPFYHLAHTYVLGDFNGVNGGGFPGENSSHSYVASTEDHMKVLKFAVEEAGMEYDRATLINTLVPIWQSMANRNPTHKFRKELLNPDRVNRRIEELLEAF